MTDDGQHVAQRRAALVVHAMAPEDREWVLRELPLPQRDLLQPWLTELRELGIPQDPALLGSATLGPTLVSVASADQLPYAALSAASARSLGRWLRCEPPQVGARLLQACPAWRARILRALPRSERRSIACLVESLPRAPELERWVLAAAQRHLRTVAVTSPLAWLRKAASSITSREQRRWTNQ